MSAAPAAPQMPELDVGQTVGWALLESLCAHLDPGNAAKTGATLISPFPLLLLSKLFW